MRPITEMLAVPVMPAAADALPVIVRKLSPGNHLLQERVAGAR
jgi:hypothetical protein